MMMKHQNQKFGWNHVHDWFALYANHHVQRKMQHAWHTKYFRFQIEFWHGSMPFVFMYGPIWIRKGNWLGNWNWIGNWIGKKFASDVHAWKILHMKLKNFLVLEFGLCVCNGCRKILHVLHWFALERIASSLGYTNSFKYSLDNVKPIVCILSLHPSLHIALVLRAGLHMGPRNGEMSSASHHSTPGGQASSHDVSDR